MRSSNLVYPLPQGAFSVYINGDHNHISRCKSYSWMETGLNKRESFSFGAMPIPNIPDLTKARQDLPLPDILIGALEPSLYGTIIHEALILLAYLNRICKKIMNIYIYIYIYVCVCVYIYIYISKVKNNGK